MNVTRTIEATAVIPLVCKQSMFDRGIMTRFSSRAQTRKLTLTCLSKVYPVLRRSRVALARNDNPLGNKIKPKLFLQDSNAVFALVDPKSLYECTPYMDGRKS